MLKMEGERKVRYDIQGLPILQYYWKDGKNPITSNKMLETKEACTSVSIKPE